MAAASSGSALGSTPASASAAASAASPDPPPAAAAGLAPESEYPSPVKAVAEVADDCEADTCPVGPSPLHAAATPSSRFLSRSRSVGAKPPLTTKTEYPSARSCWRVIARYVSDTSFGCLSIELRSNQKFPTRRSANQCSERLHMKAVSRTGLSCAALASVLPMGRHWKPRAWRACWMTCTLKKPSARTLPLSMSRPAPPRVSRSILSRVCATSLSSISSNMLSCIRLFRQ
mmetsp:Transcript_36962/g.94427  ORF Transcript_36962/g.94427 Transcript_36962/m.94427 type:complete len:231 (-) Transcript_36962:418-1110(-)